jgi:hypothetical protein
VLYARRPVDYVVELRGVNSNTQSLSFDTDAALLQSQQREDICKSVAVMATASPVRGENHSGEDLNQRYAVCQDSVAKVMWRGTGGVRPQDGGCSGEFGGAGGLTDQKITVRVRACHCKAGTEGLESVWRVVELKAMILDCAAGKIDVVPGDFNVTPTEYAQLVPFMLKNKVHMFPHRKEDGESTQHSSIHVNTGYKKSGGRMEQDGMTSIQRIARDLHAKVAAALPPDAVPQVSLSISLANAGARVSLSCRAIPCSLIISLRSMCSATGCGSSRCCGGCRRKGHWNNRTTSCRRNPLPSHCTSEEYRHSRRRQPVRLRFCLG